MKAEIKTAVVTYCLRIGDDRLILGQRLSEWCGHAPILEEDIALANIALDLIGQAAVFLELAGKIDGHGKKADHYAYFRDERQFYNLQLVELPRGDFAATIARQFLFDAWDVLFLSALAKGGFSELAAIAEKSLKEAQYHYRHSSQWVLRLGDGTTESRDRITAALADLWSCTEEMFISDPIDQLLYREGIAVNLEDLKPAWRKIVTDVLTAATLSVPSDDCYMARGARQGKHSEHLGHLLAEMQILPRSYPNAQW